MRIFHVVVKCLAVSAMCISLLSASAHAGSLVSLPLDLTLSIDNPIQTVGQNESILINATLTNEQTSPASFNGFDASPYIFNGTLLDLTPGAGNPYNVSFGSIDSISLNPGESTSFTFITLIPDPEPVAAGFYSSLGIGINYGDDGVGGQYDARSTSGIEITVIPEPASIAMGAMGVLAIVLRRRG